MHDNQERIIADALQSLIAELEKNPRFQNFDVMSVENIDSLCDKGMSLCDIHKKICAEYNQNIPIERFASYVYKARQNSTSLYCNIGRISSTKFQRYRAIGKNVVILDAAEPELENSLLELQRRDPAFCGCWNKAFCIYEKIQNKEPWDKRYDNQRNRNIAIGNVLSMIPGWQYHYHEWQFIPGNEQLMESHQNLFWALDEDADSPYWYPAGPIKGFLPEARAIMDSDEAHGIIRIFDKRDIEFFLCDFSFAVHSAKQEGLYPHGIYGLFPEKIKYLISRKAFMQWAQNMFDEGVLEAFEAKTQLQWSEYIVNISKSIPSRLC